MSSSAHGRVALVVGGTSGIGLATAEAFAADGASVIVAARESQRGFDVERRLRAASLDVSFVSCDVRDPGAVEHLMDAALERFGRIDCAVNCAATDWLPCATHEVSPDEANDLASVDILGVFHCLKYEIAAMLPLGAGTIVNVSSVNGLSGTPSGAMYSAGRHAVIGLTRSTAREYIGRGIRINAVCPGPTDTPRRARRSAGVTEVELLRQSEHLAELIPIGRMASAEEIANAIIWLSSPASSYVVGHCLVIDGGFSA